MSLRKFIHSKTSDTQHTIRDVRSRSSKNPLHHSHFMGMMPKEWLQCSEMLGEGQRACTAWDLGMEPSFPRYHDQGDLWLPCPSRSSLGSPISHYTAQHRIRETEAATGKSYFPLSCTAPKKIQGLYPDALQGKTNNCNLMPLSDGACWDKQQIQDKSLSLVNSTRYSQIHLSKCTLLCTFGRPTFSSTIF